MRIPSNHCPRTLGRYSRAVRLLNLLGRNVDPSAYPKVKYDATKEPVTVDDEDAERALGEGWAERPAAFEKR